MLGLIVSDMLFRAFPKADEGELSKRLADLVRKESCADVAKSLGLVDDVKLGMVKAVEGARLRKSVLGDICEAVIGAIFSTAAYEAARQFVERNWTERMNKPRRPLRDPKTVLQEWAQGKDCRRRSIARSNAPGRTTIRNSALPLTCRASRPPRASAATSARPRRPQHPR